MIPPECVADFVRLGPLYDALRGIASLADARLAVGEPIGDGVSVPDAASSSASSCDRRGLAGDVLAFGPETLAARLDLASEAMRQLIAHVSSREAAVGDLASQLCVCYEELNMTYQLLQTMATSITEEDIGSALVHQAAETLACRRVSLLVLNDDKACLRVLASVGLPQEAWDTIIPVGSSVAGKVLTEGSPFLIEDICCRPDLADLSKGSYETGTFAVIRVPLRAQGQPVGVLALTERNDHGDFTARDSKLLEALSAMGAASLMHCRLQRIVQEQMMSTIRSLALAVDAKDHYTHAHSDRVARFCVATAKRMGVTGNDSLREIELAGILHDIGKIAIPDAILAKPGKLTPEEHSHFVHTHTHVGAQIVGAVKGLEAVAAAILHHHERYDGLGYPNRLRGDAIPLASRLVAVADTFDAMTTDRPYRKALPLQTAFDELDKHSGTQFDPRVVGAFIDAQCGSPTRGQE